MYLENMQSYNTFVYECDEDKSLKQLLLNDMGFSVRAVSHTKNGDFNIKVNEKEKPKNEIIKKGDIVKVVLCDEKSDYETQYKDIKILYEDDDVLIVDKSPFTVSHPTKSHIKDTMLNYIQGIFEQKNIKSKVRFISRLDRDTSGILTIAKNSYAHYVLSQGNLSNSMKKYYTALVSGNVDKIQPNGTISEKIAKSDDGIRRIISDDGQESITHYRIIKKNERYAMIELLLETGRTHQIRIHLAHKGVPILGDELYKGDMSIVSRQALHCHKLTFVSPRTKKEVTVISDFPEDMKKIIEL